MQQLLVALLLLGLLACMSNAQPVECNAVAFCLSEGDTDCNINSNICPGGTYCRKWSSDPVSEVTGNIIGTCVPTASVGQACSLAEGHIVECYDSNNYIIFCDDPGEDGNGTCRYRHVYAPGEVCKPNDPNYSEGGCTYGACNPATSKCQSIAVGDICTDQSVEYYSPLMCVTGTFCDDQSYSGSVPTGLCLARRPLFGNCSSDWQCDSGLVCSSGGDSRGRYKCRKLFAQALGGNCDIDAECQADLYCNTDGQCVRPSRFNGEGCGSGAFVGIELFCQPGWDCECIADVTSESYVEQGGSCTKQSAVSQEFIDKFTDLAECLTTASGCQDLNYLLVNSIDRGYGPGSCIATCATETKFDLGTWDWRFPASSRGEVDKKRGAPSRTNRLAPTERAPYNPLVGLPLGKCFLTSDDDSQLPTVILIAVCVSFVLWNSKFM